MLLCGIFDWLKIEILNSSRQAMVELGSEAKELSNYTRLNCSLNVRKMGREMFQVPGRVSR